MRMTPFCDIKNIVETYTNPHVSVKSEAKNIMTIHPCPFPHNDFLYTFFMRTD